MLESKKIVFLINDITALGGTERMCTLIANALSSAEFTVTIISRYESNAAPFFVLNEAVQRVSLFSKAPSLMEQLSMPVRLYRRVMHIAPTIIVSCDTQMCLYSGVPFMRKNHIAWEHFNSGIVTRFGSRWFGRRLASLFCKKIIVLTESDKAHWITMLQTNSDKLTVIPNPLPVARCEKVAADKHKRVVLAVGRMTEQKGFDLLIESWQRIAKPKRKQWTLRIVGPNGSARPKLEALIAKYHLTKEVELADCTLEIEKEYQSAALYVLSSRYEGFGLTLIEAMGQGLPVIAFDCPMGPAEIIENKYGKLLPANDVEELARTMQRFMATPSLRNKYAELAHQRSAEYSMNNIMLRWQSMLHQLQG